VNVRKAIIGTALFFLCCLAGSAVAGYKIEKIIDVGPSLAAPYLGPLKWSPDGSKLAYVDTTGRLMASDTLGNSQLIAQLDWQPRRMEWTSNTEIAVHLELRTQADTTPHRLSVFNVTTGEEKVVASYTRKRNERDKVGAMSFDGPYCTVGGNVYFCTAASQGRGSRDITARSWITLDDSSRAKSDDHIMVWGDGGLYDVSVATGDSVLVIERVTPKYETPPLFTAVARNRSCIMYSDMITCLPDRSKVLLHEHMGEMPAGTSVCGFSDMSFHPTRLEVLFGLSCDDGERYIVDRIGTYDLVTEAFVILDTLLGMTPCFWPAYSPQGNKIAYQCNGHTYIAYRGDGQ
jgi:hypothetical protein